MDVTALRNFKDFLLLYNQISEMCFRRCAGSIISREFSSQEDECVNNCTGKYVNANHRIMGVYVEVQSALMERRIKEMNEAEAARLSSVNSDASNAPPPVNTVEVNNNVATTTDADSTTKI